MKAGFGMTTVGLSEQLFERGQICGACFEVGCVEDIRWCIPGSSIILTATSFCAPNYGFTAEGGGHSKSATLRISIWSSQLRHLRRLLFGRLVICPSSIAGMYIQMILETEWKGFPFGTKAAAAGGVTTLDDMPLNNFPSTVSRKTLELKLKAVESRIYVDAGFWGGLVPENAFNNLLLRISYRPAFLV